MPRACGENDSSVRKCKGAATKSFGTFIAFTKAMNTEAATPNYSELVEKVIYRTEKLIESESALLKAELKENVEKFSGIFVKSAVLGIFLILGMIPFYVAAIIGLGDALDGRYALSALLVGLASTVVVGGLLFATFKSLKNFRLHFEATRRSISREIHALKSKFSQEVRP